MLKIGLHLDVREIRACLYGLKSFLKNERHEYRQDSHMHRVAEMLTTKLQKNLKSLKRAIADDKCSRIRVMTSSEEFGLLHHIAESLDELEVEAYWVELDMLAQRFRSFEHTVEIGSEL